MKFTPSSHAAGRWGEGRAPVITALIDTLRHSAPWGQGNDPTTSLAIHGSYKATIIYFSNMGVLLAKHDREEMPNRFFLMGQFVGKKKNADKVSTESLN